MDDDEHLAFAVLAVCDALDTGLADATARAHYVDVARRRCHRVLANGHGHPPKTMCQCPDELRVECDCIETCICAAMAHGENE